MGYKLFFKTAQGKSPIFLVFISITLRKAPINH